MGRRQDHSISSSPASIDQRDAERLQLLELAVSRLNDIVLITEAEPLDAPGPRIVFANDAFYRHTGYTPEEVLGASPRILQGPETSRAELDRIRAALEQWQPVRAELINYTRDGTPFWLELDITPVADADGWYTHWVSVERDITERKREQQAREASTRALRLLSRCGEALIHARDESQLLEKVCQLAVDIGGYRMAWAGYALHDPDRTISPVACAGHEEGYLSGVWLSWSEAAETNFALSGRAILRGQPVFVSDITADARVRPWLEPALERGYGGIAALPLANEHGPFGVLTLYKGDRQPFPPEEQQLLQELADHLAYGICERRMRRREEQLRQAVLRIASAVSTRSGTDFFDQLVTNMTDALGADVGFISRFGESRSDDATIIASAPATAIPAGTRYIVVGTPCERALQDGRCVVEDGLEERFPADTMLANLGVRGCVSRLLTSARGQPIGILSVMYKEALQDAEFVDSSLDAFVAGAANELEQSVERGEG